MSAIRVVCRLRPMPNQQDPKANIQLSGGSNNSNPCVLVTQPERPSVKSQRGRTQNKEHVAFPVDAVLGDNAGQGAVFNVAARETVDAFLSGYNGTIMCYGQTGAGKTYTLSGDHTSNDYERRGVMPRVLEHVFQTLQEEEPSTNVGEEAENSPPTWTVRVSYLELYKEQIFDLLALSDAIDGGSTKEGFSTTTTNNTNPGNHDLTSDAFGYSSSARSAMLQGPSRLEVVETRSGAVHAKGCKTTVVRTLESALNALFEGETNRVVAEHQLNAASSRSHCVFTVHLERQSNGTDGGEVGQAIRSKLRLVDLAGSERVVRTGSVGQTFQEAKYINTSLTFLEQMVVALGDKGQGKREHVPYRSSKLTHLLKDCVGGNCLTVLIANIWPAMEHLHQTLSTLAFAKRMRRIKTNPKMMLSDGGTGNGNMGTSSEQQKALNRYKREVRILREELAMRDAVEIAQRSHQPQQPSSKTSSNTYRPLNVQDMSNLRKRVVSFVGEGPNGIEHNEHGLSGLFTVREIDTAYTMMREMILKERQNNKNNHPSIKTNISNNKPIKDITKRERKNNDKDTLVFVNDSLDEEEDSYDEEHAGDTEEEHGSQHETGTSASDLDSALQVVQTSNNMHNSSTPPLSPETTTSALPSQLPPPHKSSTTNKAVSKSDAFKQYKGTHDAGIAMAKTLKASKTQQRDAKAEVKKEIDVANTAKQHIDAALVKLEAYRQRQEDLQRGGRGILENEENDGAEVIEAEEFELLKEVKHWKRQYRTAASRVGPLKQRLVFLSGVVNRSREELVNSFDAWCRTANAGSESNGRKKNAASVGELGIKRKNSRLAFARAKSFRYERITRINQFQAEKKYM